MSPCEVSAGAGNEEAPGTKIGGFVSTPKMPRGQVLWEWGWGGQGVSDPGPLLLLLLQPAPPPENVPLWKP